MYLQRVAITGLTTHTALSHLLVMNRYHSGFKPLDNCTTEHGLFTLGKALINLFMS